MIFEILFPKIMHAELGVIFTSRSFLKFLFAKKGSSLNHGDQVIVNQWFAILKSKAVN